MGGGGYNIPNRKEVFKSEICVDNFNYPHISYSVFRRSLSGPSCLDGPSNDFHQRQLCRLDTRGEPRSNHRQCWITRKNTKGIFNIKIELGYLDWYSPADTEWAYGSAANWNLLTFNNWETWNGSNPPGTVGKDAVLHLISDDIYLDIKFLSWTSRGNGGGFSYERSTAVTGGAPIPEPSTFLLLGCGFLGVLGYSVRRKLQKK